MKVLELPNRNKKWQKYQLTINWPKFWPNTRSKFNTSHKYKQRAQAGKVIWRQRYLLVQWGIKFKINKPWNHELLYQLFIRKLFNLISIRNPSQLKEDQRSPLHHKHLSLQAPARILYNRHLKPRTQSNCNLLLTIRQRHHWRNSPDTKAASTQWIPFLYLWGQKEWQTRS